MVAWSTYLHSSRQTRQRREPLEVFWAPVLPQEGQLSNEGREEAGLLPDFGPPDLLVLRPLEAERCPLDLPSGGRLSSKR